MRIARRAGPGSNARIAARSTHIAILVRRDTSALPAESLLSALVPAWREQGVRITVFSDPAERVEADALFLHVDLTRTPDESLRLAARYPIAINAGATDISKRRISRDLVLRGAPCDGPVIVKTDRNYGGRPEAILARRAGLLRGTGGALRNLLPWSWRARLRHYPIFDSVREVPLGVWFNPDLVVERFLPERRNGHYCVRTWLFLGDQERVALFYSDDPIVKSRNILGREPLTDVPADLRQMRRALGFDFGKFDYAVVDGRTVLYDANRTPALAGVSRTSPPPWLGKLASGIWTLLPDHRG
jgi:hypothetical protein